MARSNRYSSMTDEELKELAKERNKRTGCFKKTALSAQKELWNRNHWGADEDRLHDDGYTDRSIEELQYNG